MKTQKKKNLKKEKRKKLLHKYQSRRSATQKPSQNPPRNRERPPAIMSKGLPYDGSDEGEDEEQEEVFLDDDDIIQEIPVDDEGTSLRLKSFPIISLSLSLKNS